MLDIVEKSTNHSKREGEKYQSDIQIHKSKQTDNVVVKKGIHQTQHRKTNPEQHEHQQNWG